MNEPYDGIVDTGSGRLGDLLPGEPKHRISKSFDSNFAAMATLVRAWGVRDLL